MSKYLSSIIFAFPLVGCMSSAPGLQLMSPTLDPAAVETSINNRALILNALAADARYPADDNSLPPWSEVTLAGFNFIDDQCSLYFDSLFRFQRNRDAVTSGIGAFDRTISAILQATGADSVTLSIVAQAFGLGGAVAESYTDSFLFSLPPATTRGFVTETQNTYKAAVLGNSKSISNATEAYSHIRGYLDLCLPVTIEAMLEQRVSSTRAVATSDRTGEVLGVDVTGSNTPAGTPEVTEIKEDE